MATITPVAASQATASSGAALLLLGHVSARVCRGSFPLALQRRRQSLLLRRSRRRPFSSSSSSPPGRGPFRLDHSLVDASQAPSDFVSDDAVAYPDAVTEEEGECLLRDVQAKMKRRRYEKGHWDAVITDYKEVELPLPSDGSFASSPLSDESCAIIERIRSSLSVNHFGPSGILDHAGVTKGEGTDRPLTWMLCHGIDLRKDGQLNAHVDSVRFSGGMVAGLSLMSGCIMRLKPAPPGEIARSAGEDGDGDGDAGGGYSASGANDGGEKREESAEKEEAEKPYLEGHVDLYLPPLSLYVLSGVARYKYTHELLPSGALFRHPDRAETVVERDRRISIIFRDAK